MGSEQTQARQHPHRLRKSACYADITSRNRRRWTCGDGARLYGSAGALLQVGEQPFSMYVNLQNKFDWVLCVGV